jgi:signal peptidase II
VAYLAVIIAVVVFDQLTKYAVISNFSLYQSKEVIPGFFNLVYVTNTGAAFSLLADVNSPWRHYFFLAVGSIAVVGLTVAYLRLRTVSSLYAVSLGLIVGGAIGNLIDRIAHGAVIDFLDFYLADYHWPAFNVADSAICVGVVLFLLLNVLEIKKEKNQRKTNRQR